MTVGIACVGAGYWGKNLVRNFAMIEGARLVAVCETDPKIRQRMAKEYPETAVTGSLVDVLANDQVQAVVIATPAATHASLAREALRAGKDVFVEKPLALSTVDAESILEEARKVDRLVMVGHLLAYHPAFERVLTLSRSGELGDVFYVYCQRLNLGKVRTDENALWSLGPHDLSMIFALIDSPVSTVSARGHAYLRPGTEDVVFVNIAFENGATANVHLSWLDPHKERKLTVVGSKKMVVFDDAHPTEKLRIHDKGFDRAPEYESYDAFLTIRDGDIHIPRISMEEPLRLECRHFVECVLKRSQPRTGGQQGLAVVRALELADRSMKLNGRPIGALSVEHDGVYP